MATFQGSLLRIEKNQDDCGCTAVKIPDISRAPYSVVERKSGSLLITLARNVFVVKQDMVCRTILNMSES